MSMAASGKSTFAQTHDFYSGYRVIDYARQLPRKRPWTGSLLYLSRALPLLRRAVANNKELVAIRQENYFSGVIEFMRAHQGPVVILGRRLPEGFIDNQSFEGIAIGMVLIPEEEHRRHCLSRRKEMRNPIPFMHHWTTDFKQVRAIREQMTAFARRYDIPVFASFEQAIDDLKVD
ncbi:MAG: hypothetical protein ACREQ1_13455 [Woeseiaceae bacterium]